MHRVRVHVLLFTFIQNVIIKKKKIQCNAFEHATGTIVRGFTHKYNQILNRGKYIRDQL